MKKLLLIFTLFFTFEAFAKEVTEDEFKDVAGKLRCPTCQGMSVLESDAPFSEQIKGLVREKLGEGMSSEQIQDYFVGRYGPWILREPPRKGFHLMAWVIPIGLLIAGPILLWLLAWRRQPERAEVAMRSDAEILAEMTAALATLKKGRT